MKSKYYMLLLVCGLQGIQGCQQDIKTCKYNYMEAACGELLFFTYDKYKNDNSLKKLIIDNGGTIIEEISELNMIRAKFEKNDLIVIKNKFEKQVYIKHISYNYVSKLE
ncbi:MAG: hypothetical protein VSS52_001500 [Thiotrichaceae bacterium]|nr:hypothetical protein [Thiotrichaceae bacterium]